MSKIQYIFNNQNLNESVLEKEKDIPDARVKFIIAITPRSGSSMLCDVLKNTHSFGRPDELISQHFLPEILTKIPGRSPDDYLVNVIKRLKSKNGVSGLKASWFQFRDFTKEMVDKDILDSFRYIYLVRRDVYAQAVSLYKATSTSVFHTNIFHAKEALEKLASLEYDFDTIEKWYRHICAQESGWRAFFDEHHIFPLVITYEDLESDVMTVVKRIADYLGIAKSEVPKCKPGSIFKKLGDRSNLEWTCRFALELDQRKRDGTYTA